MSDPVQVNGPPAEKENPPLPENNPGERKPANDPKPKPKTASQKLDEAADQFANIVKKLGGPANAKAFYALHRNGAFDTGDEDEDEYEDENEDKEPGKNDKGRSEDKDKEKRNAFDRARELAALQKLNLDFQDRSKFEVGLPSRPPGYGARYLDNDWHIQSIGGVDNPATLNENAWSFILKANRILHGWTIREHWTLTKARRPAFELKPLPGNGSNASTKLPIPDFEVFDSAEISIKETKNETEQSLASNGFSSEAIQATATAGGWGISLSVSGGYNKENQTGANNGDFKSEQAFTATYSFPRVRLFMDEFDLQLTSECRATLKNILQLAGKISRNLAEEKEADFEDAVRAARKERDRFFAQYGHVFATVMQLGGQLTATRSASSLGAVEDSQKRDSMKIAAAASFEISGGGFGFGTSLKYDKETQDSRQTHKSDVSNQSRLAWSARGGNTLLCANPPEWANSLAGFQTWRTLEQSGIFAMPDLITRLSDDQLPQISQIRDAFKVISQQQFTEKPRPQNPQAPTVRKFRLETPDGRQLLLKDGKLVLSEQGASSSNAVLFTYLSADWDRKDDANPTMKELLVGTPLFLVTNNTYAREPAINGGQIPGLWVDKDGFLREETRGEMCICRWVLRPGTHKTEFDYRLDINQITIEEGAEVKLYCLSHSSGGGYGQNDGTYSAMPFWTPSVMISSEGKPELKVLELEAKYFNQYHEVNLGPLSANFQSAFYRIQWPEEKEYDLIARDDSNAETKQSLRDLDCGIASKEQKDQLTRLRCLFSFNNQAKFSYFFGDSLVITGQTTAGTGEPVQGQIPGLGIDIIGENLAGDIDPKNPFPSVGVSQGTDFNIVKTSKNAAGYGDFMQAVSKILAKAVDTATQTWKTATKYDQEAVFRVRFVDVMDDSP